MNYFKKQSIDIIKYYIENNKFLKENAKNKYRNLSEEEKEAKL